MESLSVIRFDGFVLDLGSYELKKSGRTIHLEKIPMELLILLAEKRGRLVTREEIIKRLWADKVHVDTRQGINTAIRKIRLAVRDDPEQPRILQTVSGKGYRLISEPPPMEEALSGQLALADTSTLPEMEVKPRPDPRNWSALVVIAALLVFGAAISGTLVRQKLQRGHRPSRIGSIHSIAVLPLANFSGDPQQEYLADGMTDELITNLAKNSGLQVISRTSVMMYKGTTAPLRQIGKELNVDAVVVGSVARAGERIRITAQLVEASTDQHLWADSYERDLHDVLQLQDDLALAIAYQVDAKLAPRAQERVVGAHQLNPQAYELYLKARYLWEKRTEAGFALSLDYFQRAIDLDADYAPAHAGMAEVYGLLGNNGFMPAGEVYLKAKVAALKALEIDPRLADAHTSLAEVISDYEWNWAAAEKEYQRAIELNSNDATAHHWYAMTLAWQGRLQEAIGEIEKARQLDPLSMRVNTNVMQILFWARDYDRALRESHVALDLHPNAWGIHRIVGMIHLQRGDCETAIDELR
ncbi:MAG TPA: winged helix-turn-helix domain-containing protein, partial [Ktedonobacteraceae bacterium]|nr:winged helix-turn-helix domain-containing protein [Ktedonobacteraceae bacterium]